MRCEGSAPVMEINQYLTQTKARLIPRSTLFLEESLVCQSEQGQPFSLLFGTEQEGAGT